MNVSLKIDPETRLKHSYTLGELSVIAGPMPSVEEIQIDLGDIYYGVSAVVRAVNTLLRDRRVGVEFRNDDITKLRAMQRGFSEMFSEFVFSLETRACR